MVRIVILYLLTTFLQGCGQIDNLDDYINNLHEKNEFNGTVLVTQGDSVLYEKAFGYADETRNVQLTIDHRFALGSIYKEFPAVAVMQLKETGLLSVDDKIATFLPQLPSWSERITIKNLFQYSSGLPKIDWNTYFQKEIRLNEDRIMADLENIEKLEFEPGTDYLYSNYNPMLLMQIVERLTGMTFKHYVEQNLLSPFGIEGIVLKEEYPFEETDMMAIPFDHQYKVDDYEVEMITFYSSAQGMRMWFSQLDNFQILSRESMQLLSEEIFPGEDSQSPLGRCDLEDDDIKLHFHHGNSQNYECLVRHYKQDKFMVILMTNQDNENLYDIADNIYEFYQLKGI